MPLTGRPKVPKTLPKSASIQTPAAALPFRRVGPA
jgi:hypothetical protein